MLRNRPSSIWKQSASRVGVLCLLPLLLVACEGFDAVRFEQLFPVIGNESTVAISTVPVVEPYPPFSEPDLVETPILMCTPPACGPGEVYACPTGDCPGGCGTVCAAPTTISGPIAPSPTDWENLEGWLAALWRGGANPAAVRAALQQSGMQKNLDDWRAADFNGDFQDEWVLVLYDPTMPGAPWGEAGDLWIVNDNGPVFRYYIAPSSDIFEFFAPTIVGLADLTGNGRPELVAETVTCGAHTCISDYRVIGHTPEGYRDLISNPDVQAGVANTAITMPSATARIEDFNRDGIVELLVHGGGIGSAGAGVVRTRTEVWRWDGTAVTLAETLLDTTDYRHHILYEANDLMAGGDLAGALSLYEATINDGALRNDGFGYPPEETYQAVSRFAAFRLILIDLMRGAPVRASDRLAWLQATYPGSAAAQAATILIQNWSGPESLAGICATIESSLANLENPTGALVDMGYGNPRLTAADYCP